MSIDVYVVTHKKIDAALPDYCKKVQINVANTEPWEGYIHDNDGDNISARNPYYCELTALYHLWKNCKSDYKGLYHYRRYFTYTDSRNMTVYYPRSCGYSDLYRKIISEDKAKNILREKDIILAVPHNPFPASVFEALTKFISPDNIKLLVDVIYEKYPEYYEVLWDILNSYQISYCNMFIASDRVTDNYCKWLFEILELVEDRIEKDKNGNPPKRIFGYYSEVLLNVYVKKNSLRIKYLDMLTANDNSRLKNTILGLRDAANRGISYFSERYPLLPTDKGRLYKSRSLLWRNEKTVLPEAVESLEEIQQYYNKVGALATEIKESASSIKYVKAVMNYRAANECFLCFVLDRTLFGSNDIEKTIAGIAAAEKDDSHNVFIRIYSDEAISEENKRRFLLKGFKYIT